MTLDGLVPALQAELKTKKTYSNPPEAKNVDKLVLAAMSFARKSVAVIVDLSEAKPNVLYETGYAHALKKPCIHICSTTLEKLPFDVANWKTTLYHPGQTHKLAKELAQRLKAVLER